VVKEVELVWGTEQAEAIKKLKAEAMKKLKAALISAPALMPLVYAPEEGGFVGRIVLRVDASRFGFGAILQQEDRDGKRHPVRYESGLWTPAESRYDAVKLECRGLRAIKKFRYYLYGVHFLVEIDARTLVHQLNQPTSDLPGTIVGRWLAYTVDPDVHLRYQARAGRETWHRARKQSTQTSTFLTPNTPKEEAKQEMQDQMDILRKELEQLRLFQQSAFAPQNNYGQSRNYSQGQNQGQGQGQGPQGQGYQPRETRPTEQIPVNDQGCRWCGLNNHRKYNCFDYNRSLREGEIHYIDEADKRTRMGPTGSGGPLIPLPERAGVWQKVWLMQNRRRTESQGTVPAASGGRIAEVGQGTTSEVRNLMLEYTPRITEEEEDETVFPAVNFRGPELEVGEVRTHLVLQDEKGQTTGWLEAKRGIEGIEDTIVVNPEEWLRQKRQKQQHYPGVGTRNRPSVTIEDTEDEEDIAERARSEAPEGEEILIEEDEEEEQEEETPPAKKKGEKKTSRKRRKP